MGPSGNSQRQLFDVVVVGAGLVGSALAWRLAAVGYRVCVCEAHPAPPQQLRMEHLSHQVVSLYRDMGLFEQIRPVLIPVDSTAHFRNGHLVRAASEAPYVAAHDQLVQALRPRLAKVVTMVWERAVHVSAHGRVKSVRLESGEVVCGWMVVVASGGNAQSDANPLDLPLETICPDYCRAFSWDLELEDPERMTHHALVFRSTHTSHGYNSLKLFDLGEGRIRANFLTYWPPADKRRNELLQGDALALLARTVEGLIAYAGPFRLTSPIEETVTHLTRPADPAPIGLVLAGDACGQSAPSGGLALRKGLHDVRVIAELMPRWERETRSGTEDIAAYYAHSAKLAVDKEALARSVRERKVAIDWRPAWATRRLIGDQLPDWLESTVVRPAVQQSLNLVRIYRSGLDN